jgi:hypothetical protein
MSLQDIERIAAPHNDNPAMVAFRQDLVRAFERGMARGLPLPHCVDVAVGMVIGAMAHSAGVERTRQELLPAMITNMQAIVDVLASPEAQGRA